MNKKNKKLQIVIHIAFAIIVIGIIVILISKFFNFFDGEVISGDDFNHVYEDAPETENMDYILPLIVRQEDLKEDDGETTIVCFGNAPFADDRGEEDNLCNMVADMTGATVYNCSIPGSYMTAEKVGFHSGENPWDAFSFYWMISSFCLDNGGLYADVFGRVPDIDRSLKEITDLLLSIDFNDVDIVVIMYDGSDYLADRGIVTGNPTDTMHFTGAMTAGIEALQAAYPHIRIIVMSPTYAYGLEEDGSYVSSDIKLYESGHGHLSTYVVEQAKAAYTLSVSFVDNLYGTIHEDIASDYLTDHIHLNLEGRKLVAKRLVDAINQYPDPVVE